MSVWPPSLLSLVLGVRVGESGFDGWVWVECVHVFLPLPTRPHGASFANPYHASDRSPSPLCSSAHLVETLLDRVATPYRDGISACFGAFGIHLSSRLGAAYKAWLAILGQQTPPNTMAGGMQTNTQNAENCDWIGDAATKLDLPDFPDFPAKFELPPVVPIP